MPCGEVATAVGHEDRQDTYVVENADGKLVLRHWSWEVVCQARWGWPCSSVGGMAAAEALHASRFRNRETFHIDGANLKIEDWSVVGRWHVALRLEGGRRIEVDRGDRVVSDSEWSTATPKIVSAPKSPVNRSSEPDPVVEPVPVPEPEPVVEPSGQLSMFG